MVTKHDFFPYYEEFPNDVETMRPEIQQRNLDAHNLWEAGAVVHMGGNEYIVEDNEQCALPLRFLEYPALIHAPWQII